MATRSDPARALDVRLAEAEANLAREMRVSKALREVGLRAGDDARSRPAPRAHPRQDHRGRSRPTAPRSTCSTRRTTSSSRASRTGEEVRSIRLKVGHGIAGHVARTGKPLHVRDAYKDPRFSPEWDVLSGYRTRSILAAPMKNHLGRTIGVVQVLNKKQRRVHRRRRGHPRRARHAGRGQHRQLAPVHVGHQKNIQLVDTKEQLEHRVRDLKLLFDLESAMGARDLARGALRRRARRGDARVRGARGGRRAARPRGRASERSTSSTSGAQEDASACRVSAEGWQGLIGWAMRARRGPRHERRRERSAQRQGVRRPPRRHRTPRPRWSVPLEGDDEAPMGAIALYNKRAGRPFSDEDRALLELIAANASTAIRLQLSREAREREERLTTIGRLLSSVIHDLKTPLTVISGYVQLMQAADETRRSATSYAELILKQFDHIGAMQREVLEFARGEKSILVRKVYLQKFFEDVRDQLEKRSRAARHRARGRRAGARAPRASTRARCSASSTTSRATRPRRWATKGGKFAINVTSDKESGDLVVTLLRHRPRHPQGDRAPALPVLRHQRQEGRDGPRPGHREEDRRGARRDHQRAARAAGRPSSFASRSR